MVVLRSCKITRIGASAAAWATPALLPCCADGGSARQAGLAAGDVILQVGREEVGSVAEFAAAARAFKAGDEVRLLVRNARSTGFVVFTLR